MAMQMQVDGLTEIAEMLTGMEERAGAVAAGALYEGAGLMAAEINKGAAEITTAPFKYARPGETRLPSPEEKEIVLQAGVGIAKFDRNGTEVNTSVGYRNAGYAMLDGKQKPIPQIVNAINSGTSFMKKQPFVRKAATTGAKKAEAAITKTIEQKFEELMKN